jgi:hypothetical protein
MSGLALIRSTIHDATGTFDHGFRDAVQGEIMVSRTLGGGDGASNESVPCANDRLLLGELLVFVDPVCARTS